ncbi:hypothetical protein TNCV_2113461 [Trichonephila clavipes]|nr:hypothetical protein TNCV_2113461 [Trichonephila clavipes]
MAALILLSAARNGHIQYDTAHKAITCLERRCGATPVSSFIVVRPIVAAFLYVAVPRKVAIMVTLQNTIWPLLTRQVPTPESHFLLAPSVGGLVTKFGRLN